jgi:tRNA threonylcarbamoyladenosine biosynthesis protein TsaB
MQNPSTILAIDTCEAYCSAALVSTAGTFSRSEKLGRGHAERLLPMVEELLHEASLEYGDIGRIAVTTGPGTFTGLRIGLSVARGLSLSLKLSCVGLSTLLLLAAQADHDGPVHSVMMGRGGQVFYQAFEGRQGNGLPKPIDSPINIDADEAVALIEATSGLVIGSGVPAVMGREAGDVDAPSVVQLAELAMELDPLTFPPDPFYLRAADAIKAKPVFQINAGS